MTAVTEDREVVLQELLEREGKAWSSYSESLKELAGREYEEEEARSWTRLQKELKTIESQRQELARADEASPT